MASNSWLIWLLISILASIFESIETILRCWFKSNSTLNLKLSKSVLFRIGIAVLPDAAFLNTA